MLARCIWGACATHQKGRPSASPGRVPVHCRPTRHLRPRCQREPSAACVSFLQPAEPSPTHHTQHCQAGCVTCPAPPGGGMWPGQHSCTKRPRPQCHTRSAPAAAGSEPPQGQLQAPRRLCYRPGCERGSVRTAWHPRCVSCGTCSESVVARPEKMLHKYSCNTAYSAGNLPIAWPAAGEIRSWQCTPTSTVHRRSTLFFIIPLDSRTAQNVSSGYVETHCRQRARLVANMKAQAVLSERSNWRGRHVHASSAAISVAPPLSLMRLPANAVAVGNSNPTRGRWPPYRDT